MTFPALARRPGSQLELDESGVIETGGAKVTIASSPGARVMTSTPKLRSDETRLSPAVKLPELTKREEQAVEAQSRPNAALIHETIRAEGESELERASIALLLSGLAAGL